MSMLLEVWQKIKRASVEDEASDTKELTHGSLIKAVLPHTEEYYRKLRQAVEEGSIVVGDKQFQLPALEHSRGRAHDTLRWVYYQFGGTGFKAAADDGCKPSVLFYEEVGQSPPTPGPYVGVHGSEETRRRLCIEEALVELLSATDPEVLTDHEGQFF